MKGCGARATKSASPLASGSPARAATLTWGVRGVGHLAVGALLCERCFCTNVGRITLFHFREGKLAFLPWWRTCFPYIFPPRSSALCCIVRRQGLGPPALGLSRRSDSRRSDSRLSDSRLSDSRLSDSRFSDSRLSDSRLSDSRLSDSRLLRVAGLRVAGLRVAGLRVAGLQVVNIRVVSFRCSNFGYLAQAVTRDHDRLSESRR